MNVATISAMTLAARLEALIPDPVYTGKSMAGQDCPSHASHGMK
jgi:1-aminocyclopropane-1-carboxylate deaminase/D-cysteine desulfhydrase-like pyridoxal-dependent ACC family enzyme